MSLWALLDELEITRPNIVGYSLGGAVALEMALQRPDSVPRLGLINSLTSYRPNTLNKWLEARLSVLLINCFGIGLVGRLCAARMFPHPWQRSLRERAAAVVGAAAPAGYIAIIAALVQWSGTERLERLKSRVLIIAAEHDLTPMGEKRELALLLGAAIAEVQGSRHGTPFDAVEATNACILALLSDKPLPSAERLGRDESPVAQHSLDFAGSLAAQHALGP
jgi:pimeloyl-ACP methyl ester carboxylesterase